MTNNVFSVNFIISLTVAQSTQPLFINISFVVGGLPCHLCEMTSLCTRQAKDSHECKIYILTFRTSIFQRKRKRIQKINTFILLASLYQQLKLSFPHLQHQTAAWNNFTHAFDLLLSQSICIIKNYNLNNCSVIKDIRICCISSIVFGNP